MFNYSTTIIDEKIQKDGEIIYEGCVDETDYVIPLKGVRIA